MNAGYIDACIGIMVDDASRKDEFNFTGLSGSNRKAGVQASDAWC